MKMGVGNLIFGAITWIILFIILVIPVILLLIYKYTVIICTKIFRPDLRTLKANDKMVAPDASSKKSIINFGFLIKCKGAIKVEAMRDRFSTCFLDPRNELDKSLPKYENLYSYIVTYGGYAFRKVVADINIADHILEQKLGPNECIEDLAANWMLKKFIDDGPAWEIVVVPLISTEETAICFKIHHALADGYSLLYIIDKITGVKSPYLVQPFQESILTDIRQTIEYPTHLSQFAGDPQKNPFKISSIDKPLWIYSFATLDLGVIKAIRRKHNVHFASVILTLVVGALRRYLLETKTEDEFPKFLSCATTLPLPNHPVRSPNVTLCNHWIAGILKLPLNIDDPLERLKNIEASFVAFSNLGLHNFTRRFMLPFVGLLPAGLMRVMFSKDPGYPIGLTSLVGGNDYKMIARPISVIQPLLAVPDSNPFIAFSCFTFSHSNNLDLTCGVHPEYFPDHETLTRITINYLNDELVKLRSISQ